MSIIQKLEDSSIKNYRLPDRLIKLQYSSHSMERLRDRTTGSLILAPQYIRLTKDNTTDLIIRKGRVVGATVMLEYKKGTYLYLPMTIGGIVKTIYFEKNRAKTGQLYIKKRKRIKEIQPTQDCGTETTGLGQLPETIKDVQRNMGGTKKFRWLSIFRTLWNMARN